MVKIINLMEPILDKEMLESATSALKNEFFLKGESVKKFEEEFAAYIDVKHAIAVNSGTTALHLSLLALGIGEGDYVLTTTFSFIATANAIRYTGAEPLFADISLDDYNLDISQLESIIKKKNGKIQAIVPVHLYGYPVNMDEINRIAEENNLKVVEDACQSHGGSYKNHKMGALSDSAAFSFYPSKNMTVGGDGGMITTNNSDIADKIKVLRDCGRSKNDGNIHEEIGYTARLNTVNAAIGRIQLKRLDSWIEKRREIVEKYRVGLEGIGDLILPPIEKEGIESAWHLFVIRTKERNALLDFLKKEGVRCGIHYKFPIHLQPAYRENKYHDGMFPNAELAASQVLSLPLHTLLTDENINYIIEKIKSFYIEAKE
ncbi:MAG: DegT/DnrJ/EryC1/StrS family aminotransferase [Candidatus Heimdallarchaeaceae archaeon]